MWHTGLAAQELSLVGSKGARPPCQVGGGIMEIRQDSRDFLALTATLI